MVALDSAVILNPRVWEASGHVAGFSDPLVDCRTCKLRFRADRLEDCAVRQASRASGRARLRVRPHRGAPVQPDVPDAGRRDGGRELDRVPPARDRAGHLHQLQERDAARAAQAAVRHRADRQVVPQRDHARQLPLPRPRVRADGDGVLRAAGRGAALVRVLARAAPPVVPRPRPAREQAARPRARRGGALALLERRRATSSTSTPSAGRSSRASRTAATST